MEYGGSRSGVAPGDDQLRVVALSCLDACGYQRVDTPDANDLRFLIRTKAGKNHRAQLLISPREKVVRLIVHLDSIYPRSRIPFVAEVVHRLNCELAVLGGFGLDWATGGVFFRYGRDLRDAPATKTMFEHMLNSTAFPVGVFERAMPFLARGKASASAVIGMALALSDVGENAYLSKDAKKLFITLVK